MVEQPFFGRRLKELRREQGLSQAALAGHEISTGYLSRLESGERRPTERLVSYFADRLGVEPTAFASSPASGSLAQVLSIATSTDSEEAVENLISVLNQAQDDDPLLRWRALWLVSRHWRRLGMHDRERSSLEELVVIADRLGLAELRCRAWSQLARLLRSTGEVTDAIDLAARAHRLAAEAGLSVSDIGAALQTLVAAEAEAGRLPDARAHVDELIELVEQGGSPALRAEAYWSAATVRLRQGDHEQAREHLEHALGSLDSHVDLTLWVRLRLAAASLYLQSDPPLTDQGRDCLEQAEAALSLIGITVVRQQELLMLHAYLAFHEKRFDDARRAHDDLVLGQTSPAGAVGTGELRLTYRDQVRLGILDSRLLLLEGHRAEGLARLKELGAQTWRTANVDLAADIWRILAQALEESDHSGPGA
jgi:transcriptional regulator with XRE-family HTH domain